MSSSTLDPENTLLPDQQLGKGHGIDALGPSDISDTGSDAQGGYRALEDDDLVLDRGIASEDKNQRAYHTNHQAEGLTEIDDLVLTGQIDDMEFGKDIGFDRIDSVESVDTSDENVESENIDKFGSDNEALSSNAVNMPVDDKLKSAV
jgi:hypothetical protein